MIAVLFAVDTIPDVTEGVANVTGDMAAVAIVGKSFKEIQSFKDETTTANI